MMSVKHNSLFAVAWFQLTKSASQREIFLSNESHTLTATTIDYQTILGSVAFSKVRYASLVSLVLQREIRGLFFPYTLSHAPTAKERME